MCIGLLAAAARDPITATFCAGVTIPYTAVLVREWRDRNRRTQSRVEGENSRAPS
jgi:hypothetical protein